MQSLRLRHRHRLRRKEVAQLVTDIERTHGCPTFGSDDVLEVAEAGQYRLLISKGKAFGIYIGDELFLSIRGLLEHQAIKRYVTVDMGAVKFIANGADVMAPGVVDAELSIREEQGVWVRDLKNNQPLAVGIALMDARTMIDAVEGKAVNTIHYVGDKIWMIGE